MPITEKNLFGTSSDNFSLRLYKSKAYLLPKVETKLLENLINTKPVFDLTLIKRLLFRQLYAGSKITKSLPISTRLSASGSMKNVDDISFEDSHHFRQRIIVGKGLNTIFETGMQLHHIYGFPYIPASAVKGVLRSWIILEYFGNPDLDGVVPDDEKDYPLHNAEARALQNETFCRIFGCGKDTEKYVFRTGKPDVKAAKETIKTKFPEKGHIGNVVFFDAYPSTAPNIKLDIINPHYPEYYKDGKTPPADWQSPVPIFFLTVEDTAFQFLMGMHKNAEDFENTIPHTSERDIIEFLKEELGKALSQHGIGAKTAVGYGRL